MAGEVGSIFVRVGANTGDFDRGMSRVHGTLGRFGGLMRGAGLVALAGGAAIAGGLAFAIKAAANFEQQLNTFQAVSGATGKEMAKVSKLAKKMGKDLTLPGTSAKDAAEALTELAKGGLTVNKAMKALKATLQLSAAAQISNARAAVIVSDALNAFGLKAKEAGRVVDLLANAANATSGDIEDFADAMQMSGAVAKQLGVPIEDLVTMLGEMANAGIKGSDAGTSVKQMLLSLAAPTEKSANLMKDLGVNIFDAQGKFAGMHSVIEQFHGILGKMTDKQKAATLATIFGSDAVRAAAIIFGKSAPEFERLKTIMEKQGAAAKLAEAKMKGFKGALEGLKSALETVAINIGEPLLRFATSAVKQFSKFVEWLDRLRAQKGFTAKIKFVWEGIKKLGGFLEDLIMGKGKTTELKMVMGRGPRWLTTIDKGLAGSLTKAFQSINWAAVWKAAMSAVDVGREWADKLFSWLDRQDWEGLGARMGQALVDAIRRIFPKLGKPEAPGGVPTRPAPGAVSGGGGLWSDFVQNFKNLGGLIEKGGGAFTDPNGFFQPIWQKAFQGITDQATDFAKGFFKGIWSKIEEDTQAATGQFRAIGGGFATTLTEGFSSYMRSTRGFQREAQTGANEIRATGGQYGAAGTHLGQSTSTGLMGALAGMAAAASSKAGAGATGIESKKGVYTSAGQGLGSATSAGLTGALAGMAAAAGTKAAAGASAISGKKGGYTTAGQALGNSTKAGLTGALSGLGAAAASKVDQARSAVSAKAGSWSGVGSSLGSGLVSGLVGALSGLASSAISQISGAIGAVKGFFGIGSPSRVTHEQVGKPLGQGVIMGWLDGTRELPTTMSDTVRKALDRAKAAVDAARAKFSEAFSTLASDAMSAFDKVTSAFRTKTEKLIDAREFEFMIEDANQRIVDAQARLADAMAEGNAEAITSAQRELARAQWDLEKIHLEKVAEAERRNYEARRELQQRHFEKALATLQKKLEDGRIKIGTFHNKVLGLFKKFGVDLGTLGDIGGKAFVKMLLESLGAATTGAAGIASAINAALSGAGTGGGGGAGGGGGGGGGGGAGGGGGPPANPMAGQPPAHADPLTAEGFNWYGKWWRKGDIAAFREALRFHRVSYPDWAFKHPAIIQALGWPWMAKGGIVKSPTFAMLGEKGPEAVIPLNRGGGMMAPIVNVYVTLDGRQIAAASRTENIQHGRRNPTVMSGRGITA